MQEPGRYAQDTEFDLLEVLCRAARNRTFIDVGAEKGIFARFLIERGFEGVLFEPCPKHARSLEALAEATGARVYPFAIDRRDRSAELHLSRREDGELEDYFHSLQKLVGDSRVHHSDSMAVSCRSLESLAEEGLIGESVGVLKIDTEGNDLEVLEGMGSVRAEVLICEFFTEGLYAGWEAAHPEGLIEEAGRLGYRHYLAIRRRGSRELLSWGPAAFGEGLWGNLVFMRETVYRRCFAQLHALVERSERQLFEPPEDVEGATLEKQLNGLRAICAERLELIDYLHRENAARLEIIASLESKLREGEIS